MRKKKIIITSLKKHVIDSKNLPLSSDLCTYIVFPQEKDKSTPDVGADKRSVAPSHWQSWTVCATGTTMPRPVLLLLGLVFGSALAVHDSVLNVSSFTGFRVYRVLPASEADLQLLDRLQSSPFYDFWTEVK